MWGVHAQAIKLRLILDMVLEDPFIPMKAAQWFLGKKILKSPVLCGPYSICTRDFPQPELADFLFNDQLSFFGTNCSSYEAMEQSMEHHLVM